MADSCIKAILINAALAALIICHIDLSHSNDVYQCPVCKEHCIIPLALEEHFIYNYKGARCIMYDLVVFMTIFTCFRNWLLSKQKFSMRRKRLRLTFSVLLKWYYMFPHIIWFPWLLLNVAIHVWMLSFIKLWFQQFVKGEMEKRNWKKRFQNIQHSDCLRYYSVLFVNLALSIVAFWRIDSLLRLVWYKNNEKCEA